MQYFDYLWIIVLIVLLIIAIFTLYFNNQYYKHDYELIKLAKKLPATETTTNIEEIIIDNQTDFTLYGQLGFLLNDKMYHNRKIYELTAHTITSYDSLTKIGRLHLKIANMLTNKSFYYRLTKNYIKIDSANNIPITLNIFNNKLHIIIPEPENIKFLLA